MHDHDTFNDLDTNHFFVSLNILEELDLNSPKLKELLSKNFKLLENTKIYLI